MTVCVAVSLSVIECVCLALGVCMFLFLWEFLCARHVCDPVVTSGDSQGCIGVN